MYKFYENHHIAIIVIIKMSRCAEKSSTKLNIVDTISVLCHLIYIISKKPVTNYRDSIRSETDGFR